MSQGRYGHNRFAAAAVAVAALVSAGSVATAQAHPGASNAGQSSPSHAIAWHACSTATGFQCGSMSVPLDYDVPGGEHIDVAVIRHRAADPARRVGSLIWNPGGPGGGGTTSLPMVYPAFSSTLRAQFDIVSFDPRGIGASSPLTCFDSPAQEAALLDQQPVGFPVGAAQERQQTKVNAQFSAACARRGGPIQYHMSTANVARDMDRLRAAVGQRRLNYYGISYGSYLGATYVNLFPAQTGRVVLDGNVPPVIWNDMHAGRDTNTFNRLDSPLGSELALQEMMTQCGLVTSKRCSFSAGSPLATLTKYRTLLDRVSAKPVTVAGARFTYAAVVSTVSSGLFTQNDNPVTHTGWADLADLLQELWKQSGPRKTPPATLSPRAQSLARGTTIHAGLGVAPDSAPPLPEAIYGVLCSESPNPKNPASYGDQARAANDADSPDGFGYAWSWLAQPCAQWRARDTDRYTGPWNRSTSPLLLVGTLADGNTAYTGSQRMAVQLRNTRLLTETGGGHTALLNRSDCIDRYTSAYLVNGTLPAPGTVCHQNRKPF